MEDACHPDPPFVPARSRRRPLATGDAFWLATIFGSASARRGGVVRRAVKDVEARVGRAALELEVRRNGWHLFECGGQFVIVCDPSPITSIC